MKWVVLFVGVVLYGKVLDLPVRYDPFQKAKKIVVKKSIPVIFTATPSVRLDLIAIFNNKAYINGKFYTIGQNVYGYRLVAIKENYVVLKKGRQIKLLPLVEKKFVKTSER